MKKTVSLILLCFLLLLCFSGCSNPKGDEGGDKAPLELQSQDDLVCYLISYLKDIHTSYDIVGTSTAIKIDEIKNGKQALHLSFDQSNCYFVCAYYDDAHENEGSDYCCADEYTWLKFENASEICEEYKELSFVVAFQISKPDSVTDIVTKDASVPNVEHVKMYHPAFDGGVNTNGTVSFNDTFIYLNSSNKNNVYFSKSEYDYNLKTIPCVYLDGQYYIIIRLYAVYSDGSRSDDNLIIDFDEYYDALVNVMDSEKYSVTNEGGTTVYYGLIEIDDFVNCIN